MRIGRLEIRWLGNYQPSFAGLRRAGSSTLNHQLPAADLSAALAVPDTSPIWKAVHQVIDQVREEAHLESENASGANEKMCAWAAAGAQHLGLFKAKLNQLRDEALKSMEVARESRE